MIRVLHIQLRRQRNNAHFQFFTAFGDLVIEFDPAELKIEQLFELWVVEFQNEDVALKKIIKSPLTDEIHTQDAYRDEMFRGMADTNRASLNHYVPAIKTAARKLQIVFDTYGNITRLPITEKTSAISNLLAELKDAHLDDVVAAGLDGWAKQLGNSNKTLDQLIQDRWKETSTRTDFTVRDARKKVDQAYRTIIDYIHSLQDVFGSEIYDCFIKRLNAIIETYNNAVAHRIGKGGKDGDEAPDADGNL